MCRKSSIQNQGGEWKNSGDKRSAYYPKAEAKGAVDSVQVPRRSGAATTASTGPIVDNDPL